MVLCVTYFFYFGILGVMVPYTGVFLDGRGFTSEQIGSLLAVVTITRVFGPNLWAALADETGKVGQIMRFGCLMAFICFLFVFVAQGFWQLSITFGLMMLFWTAVLPQLEVITVNATRTRKGGYGSVRLWGSLGFIVLTIFVGFLLDVYSTEIIIVCIAGCLLSLYLATLYVSTPKDGRKPRQADDKHWSLVFKAPFLAFILAAVLLQVSFASYYNFFALYMQDYDYSGKQTGVLLALGVAAEILIFLVAARLISKVGVKWLLFIGMAMTALRWTLLAELPEYITAVVFAQLLHAFSFGLTHSVSIHFLHTYFPESFQSRGQAIYGSIAFGFGGALGSYVSGLTWQQGQGAYFSFMMSAALVAFAAFVLFMVPSQRFKR
jgi:PPP family 3-phenylpropionic acid transporter